MEKKNRGQNCLLQVSTENADVIMRNKKVWIRITRVDETRTLFKYIACHKSEREIAVQPLKLVTGAKRWYFKMAVTCYGFPSVEKTGHNLKFSLCFLRAWPLCFSKVN